MPDKQGHIELDRTIDSITIGARHRKDTGDLGPLMKSIETLGLLQPITITPDGVLICGWRRLEAVRRLGGRTINVWVRSGISDRLQQVMAERDENNLRQPLNEIEKATLYRELKELRAEEAQRRTAANQYGVVPGSGPGPEPGTTGDARLHAALAITGKETYHTHERVCSLMDWAERKATPPEIRAMANDALRRIEQGEAVKPLYEQVKAAYAETPNAAIFESETDFTTKANRAKERATRGAEENGKGKLPRSHGAPARFRSVRSFVLTWTELDGWTELYDVDELAASLSTAEWNRFDRVVTATLAFRDQLTAARRTRPTE